MFLYFLIILQHLIFVLNGYCELINDLFLFTNSLVAEQLSRFYFEGAKPEIILAQAEVSLLF